MTEGIFWGVSAASILFCCLGGIFTWDIRWAFLPVGAVSLMGIGFASGLLH